MMSAVSAVPSLDEHARRRFEKAWCNGAPEPIERFLPSEEHPHYLPTLVELVHIELEFAWKHGKPGGVSSPRVEDYLVRFPCLDQPNIVPALVRQERLAREQAGDAPAVDEYEARFPLIAEETAVTNMVLKTPSNRVVGDTQLIIPGYEILGELGRGGMGVVYRARQLSLNRQVALKRILCGSHFDPELIARFRNEAEVVARLQHPNIVQIFDVGDHGATPYCALELIDGGTLAQKLAGMPQPACGAAELVRTLASAMQCVHEKGIVHRDLKPANILLHVEAGEPEKCTPKISDFGLAKHLQGAPAQTQSGAVVGTPSYMAPEQAAGKPGTIGPAADIYALGAILYEMLTGRPPFKAATVAETLLQLQTEEPVPPRRFQPGVPRDLETICLKCLNKEPAKRYQSARTLADDLGRFLRGEPIRARPVPSWEPAWRWSQRNRRLAITLGSLLLAVVGSLPVMAILWRVSENRRHEAEDNARDAVAAVDDYLTRISEDRLLKEPGLQPLRKDLLQSAARYYEKFVKRRSDDPSMRAELGLAYYRLGMINELTGARPQALDYLQRAAAILEDFNNREPTNVEHRVHLAKTYNKIGEFHTHAGDIVRAEKSYRRVLELLGDQPPVDAKKKQDFLFERAIGVHDYGVMLEEAGQLRKATALVQQANGLFEQIAVSGPTTLEIDRTWLQIKRTLALWLSRDGRRREAIDLLNAAMERQKTLFDRYPDERLVLSFQVASNFRMLGACYDVDRQVAKAAGAYQEAEDILERLVSENPSVTQFQLELINVHFNRAIQQHGIDEVRETEKHYKAARDRALKLSQLHPDVPGFIGLVADAEAGLASWYYRTGDRDLAEATYKKVLPIREKLAAEHPDLHAHQDMLARAYYWMAESCRSTGRPKESEALFKKALALQEKLVRAYPGLVSYRKGLAVTLHFFGLLYDNSGAKPEAAKCYRKCQENYQQLLAVSPIMPDAQQGLSVCHNALGLLLDSEGKYAAGRQEYRDAEKLRLALVRDHPDVPEFQHELAIIYNNLANNYLASEDVANAVKIHHRARVLREKLVEKFPQNQEFRSYLSLTYYNLGNVLFSSDVAAAEDFAKKAVGLQDELHKKLPRFPEYLHDLSRSHRLLAQILFFAKKKDAGEEHLNKAVELAESLVAEHPHMVGAHKILAMAYLEQGNHLSDANRHDEAEKVWEKAKSILEERVQLEPKIIGFWISLAEAWENLGYAADVLNKTALAEERWQKGLVLRQKCCDANPIPDSRKLLAGCWLRLGDVRCRALHWEQAYQAYLEACKVRESLAGDFPDDAEYLWLVHEAQVEVARVSLELAKPADGTDWYARTSATLRALEKRSHRKNELWLPLSNAEFGKGIAGLRLEHTDVFHQQLAIAARICTDHAAGSKDRAVREQAAAQLQTLAGLLGTNKKDAIPFLRAAIALREKDLPDVQAPEFEAACNTLAAAYGSQCDCEEASQLTDDAKRSAERARTLYQRLVDLEPTKSVRQSNLAQFLRQRKDYAGAIASWNRAIELDRDNHNAFFLLGWLLATCPDDKLRDGQRAIELITHAGESTHWKIPNYLGALAGACAEVGRFDDAVKYQSQALEDAGYQQQWGEWGRQRLEMYRQKQKYREE